MFIGLQLIASFRWKIHFADFSQAFTQGGQLVCEEPLFCEIPVHELPGIEPGSMVATKKTVYGITDAPFAWNRHLDPTLQSFGVQAVNLRSSFYTLHLDKPTAGCHHGCD